MLPTTPSSSNADRAAALSAYAPYAHNHVTGTKVSWSYNEATAKMTATYAFTTTARQGSGTGTVYALYPHQRDNLTGATLSSYAYTSPRGPMRVVIGSSQFQTVSTFNGVLPQLANTGFAAGSADATQLAGYVSQVASTDPFAGFGDDTYWTGKAFGRAAQVAQIANLTGNTSARDSLVGAMRTRLTDWMTATPGETTRSFWYNPAWGTLIGYPASYGSDTDLNDHHFHYGYYVVGAATVAQFDPVVGGGVRVRRHGQHRHQGRGQLGPQRHPLPVPARLRHLRRSRLGRRARRVRGRQQPGVVVGGHELRQRPHPVGSGDRQQGGP